MMELISREEVERLYKVYGCRLDRFSESDWSVRMFADDFCSCAERRGEE